MIKKLSKYGNSQALVLDKALLELLNIQDTTKLKLSTDGTSLTITPIIEQPKTADINELSMVKDETIIHYGNQMMSGPEVEKATSQFATMTPAQKQKMGKASKQLREEFDKKYNFSQRFAELINSEAYKSAIARLDQKARLTNMDKIEYFQARNAIAKKLDPELYKINEKFALESAGNAASHMGIKLDLSKQEENISLTEDETFNHYSKQMLATQGSEEVMDSYQNITAEQHAAMAEASCKLKEEFNKKHNFDQRLAELLESKKFKSAVAKLDQKARATDMSKEDYFEAYQAIAKSLDSKFCEIWKEWGTKMSEIGVKHLGLKNKK